MIADQLIRLMQFAMYTHDSHAVADKKRFRKWDKKTPYGIHPIWCGLTLLTEQSIPEDLRAAGAEALMLHDILEDTSCPLPIHTTQQVRNMVNDLTYDSLEQEMHEIWSKTPFIRLLKLYDKTNNLMDAQKSSTVKHERYIHYTKQLLEDVLANFGKLNITKIAHTICANNNKSTD